jgi:predicted Zn finger-like uncharacterized protein
MMKITCPNCQKLLSLDETKLPMSEVSVPCPVCKTKLTVDRRKLEAGAPAQPAPAPPAPAVETPDDGEGFGEKALIVGNDHPALRHAAKLIGCIPLHVPTPQQAREFFVQEYPPVVMLNPPQITPPPLESMQPIVSLTPVDRRKAFFILFSDNLRTLDGNAAFLYGVNLVVAFKDLGAFQQIYREAYSYHERLYAPLTAVMKNLHA